MKEKRNLILYIIPIVIIVAGLCVIGYKAYQYLTTPDSASYTYIKEEKEDTSHEEVDDTGNTITTSDGVRYKLDNTQQMTAEDKQEESGGKNSDTAELEDIINELNEKADQQTVLDP